MDIPKWLLLIPWYSHEIPFVVPTIPMLFKWIKWATAPHRAWIGPNTTGWEPRVNSENFTWVTEGWWKKLGPTPPKYPKSMQILYVYAIYRWFLMMHLFKKGKTSWHPVLSSCCQVCAPIYRIPKCFCPHPVQARCIIDRTLSLASHKKNRKKQDLLIELGCLNNFPVQYSLRYMSPSEAPSLEVWL